MQLERSNVYGLTEFQVCTRHRQVDGKENVEVIVGSNGESVNFSVLLPVPALIGFSAQKDHTVLTSPLNKVIYVPIFA